MILQSPCFNRNALLCAFGRFGKKKSDYTKCLLIHCQRSNSDAVEMPKHKWMELLIPLKQKCGCRLKRGRGSNQDAPHALNEQFLLRNTTNYENTRENKSERERERIAKRVKPHRHGIDWCCATKKLQSIVEAWQATVSFSISHEWDALGKPYELAICDNKMA